MNDQKYNEDSSKAFLILSSNYFLSYTGLNCFVFTANFIYSNFSNRYRM